MQRRLKIWCAVAAFWIVVALVASSQLMIELRVMGHEFSAGKVIAMQVLQWGGWAVLTPLIIWLGRRVPIERPRLGRGIAVHVAASLAVAALHMTWVATVSWFDPSWPQPRPSFAHTLLGLVYTFHTEVLTYWATLGVSYAFEYYRRYRDRELRASELEAQLTGAQLQALRAQLQPHFLFNALHGIAGLVRSGENGVAVDMIAGLSDLLRLAIENAGKHEVPLADELEFVERYLALQRMPRFSDRLAVELDVAPELMGVSVPNLVLQPLVENAVRYGVASRSTPTRVAVRARAENGSLRLEVLDDGPGLGNTSDAGTGVGLANTRARLERLYGDGSRLEVFDRPEGGAAARLSLPLRRHGAEAADG